ncbi:hypothetical protein YC2023_089329 [Brassica napus]
MSLSDDQNGRGRKLSVSMDRPGTWEVASPISASEPLLSLWEEDILKAKLRIEARENLEREECVKGMKDRSSLLIEDKHDQSPKGVKNRRRVRAYQFEIWRCMYSRKPTSKLQGSFCKRDLRSNPFEEGGNDVPRSEHLPAWIMETPQGGDLVNQLDHTEVLPSDHAELTDHVIPSVHSVHTNHVFPLDRADQTVRTIPSDHPNRTARAVHRTTSRRILAVDFAMTDFDPNRMECDKNGAAPYEDFLSTLVEGIKPFVVHLGDKVLTTLFSTSILPL